MRASVSQQGLCAGLLLSVYLVAWFIQKPLLLNADVSWFCLAAERLLAGGTYSHDFFELNPPLAIYSYMPVVGFMRLLGWQTDMALRLYVYLIASVSLFAAACLLRAPVTKNLSATDAVTLVMLGIVFLILPLGDWGQREHLTLMLVTPYLLCVARRLQDSSPPARTFAYTIGLFAGLGFAMKPYFLVTWLLVESSYVFKKNNWRRPENGGIVTVLLLYALVMLCFQSDYLTVVVPLVSQFYYQKYSLPWQVILCSEQALFAYAVLLFYGLTARDDRLASMLAIAVTGFLVAFFLQQTPWYYHTLPFLALATVLCARLLTRLAQQPTSNYLQMTLLAIPVTVYWLWHSNAAQLDSLHFPVAFFSVFGLALGLLLLSAHQQRLMRTTTALGGILLAGLLLWTYLLHSPLQTQLALLTTVFMLLLFLLCIPDKTARGKARYLSLAILSISMLAYPAHEVGSIYASSAAYRRHYDNLLQALRAYPQQRVLIFSNTSSFAFPALIYTQQGYASRFGELGWVPTLPYGAADTEYAKTYQAHQALLAFFMPALVQDITENNPDIILVDMRNTALMQRKAYFGSQPIDYVRFFSQDAAFRTVWKKYHYVKTIDGQPLFKFRVYARTAASA